MKFLSILVLLIAQTPQGDGPEFPEQPLHCDNFKQTALDHRCECKRAMQHCEGLPEPPEDIRMDKKCKTYCKEQHCDCAGSGCRS